LQGPLARAREFGIPLSPIGYKKLARPLAAIRIVKIFEPKRLGEGRTEEEKEDI
jgi:hypothetical protein